MHTLENYITSSYKWHLSESANYNKVLLTNTFLKSRPCMTVTYMNLMLAWWLSGTGTVMAWKQFFTFFTFMFFTLAPLYVMLFAKGKHERLTALHFWATVENSFPHWMRCHYAYCEAHVRIEWMIYRASPQLSLHCWVSIVVMRYSLFVFRILNRPYFALVVLIHILISRSVFLLIQ